MLSSIALSFLALSSAVLGSPVHRALDALLDLAARDDSGNSGNSVSFNNYGGFSSMSNFDNFYGSNNFNGQSNSVTIIKENVLVCHSQPVEIIQQRLVILQEYAKRIILETICEPEVQTIVIQQHVSSISGFGNDIRRQGRTPAYDSNISGKINQIIPDSNNTISSNDLGFSGQSVGSNGVSIGGSSWDNNSSPNSTSQALQKAQQASQKNSTSSQ